jgi:SAM-dependent methyltransferase
MLDFGLPDNTIASMEFQASDPKAGEKAYYTRLGPEGMKHARQKPFSDTNCGKYLCDLGALLLMLEPAPRAVLDFGCGTGWTSLFLARAGYDVLAIDIAADAIATAGELAREADVANVEFRAADYEGFTVDRLFDYVLFYDALHHAEDEQAAVDAAYRALKPGGVMFAFEPGKGHHASAGAQHAIETYGVHEKDMPPSYIWRLGRRAGFRRKLFLPVPHQAGRSVYRRDYLRASGGAALALEKCWGYFRAVTKTLSVSSAGLTVLWK